MNKENLLPIKKSRSGIIDGSRFYPIDQIGYLWETEINTFYGKPSASIRVYNLEDLEIKFDFRNGKTHLFNPAEIPYIKIWAIGLFRLRGLSIHQHLIYSKNI